MIRQAGHALLTVDEYNETYLLPLPDVWARSILSGVPWPELNDTYKIVSSSGYTAEMRFVGKKMWGGERNGFEASIYRTNDAEKKALFTVSGNWSSRFSIFDSRGAEIEVFDLADPKNAPAPISIKPLEEQSPWESRRAWKGTFDAIKKAENGAVVNEKSKLENAQRQMRKQDEKDGKKWETMFFTRRDGHGHENNLAENLFDQLQSCEVDRLLGTNGCWRFDGEKEKKFLSGKGSFRPVSPTG